MTWSIGFRAPTAEEMLPSILRYLCDSPDESLTRRYTDVNRTATNKPGHIDQRDINRLRAMIREALAADDAAIDLCIGRFLTESADEQAEEPAEAVNWKTLGPQLKGGNVLACNSLIKFATMECDSTNPAIDSNQPVTSTLTLLVNGDAYECSEYLATLLCNSRQCRESDIKTKQDRLTVVELFNRQYLFIDDHTDH